MSKPQIPVIKWQEKYGPGFVMYSIKTGEVLATDKDYEKLEQKAEKRKIKRTLDTSVIYVPHPKIASIF